MTDTEGAAIQRDGKTYAVTTRIPAGIVTPEQLETIAAAGRKYRVPVMKITSGQRILFAGLKPEDVPRILADLGPLGKPETAPCVKFVQACVGTGCCKYGKQDSIGLARDLEERFGEQKFPAKIKIGVSGCLRSCSGSRMRDIGLAGTPKGWTVYFGGNGGTRPRPGDLVAKDLSDSDAVDCCLRLLEFYRKHAKPHERTARFMERAGMDTLRSELLSLLPYVPLEKARL